MEAPKPANEGARLRALHALEVLDTPPEEVFDRLVHLATTVFEAPIALVSLIDADRQWFKARVGLDVNETPRESSFCAWAVHDERLLVVPDATRDPRFADNPHVQGAPGIRFYAGAPLMTPDGALGTFCVLDRRPREITPNLGESLTHLARLTVEALNLRRESLHSQERSRLLREAERLGHVGHWRIDFVTGELYWSDEVFRIHGMDPAEGTPTLEEAIAAYHPEDRARVEELFETAMETKQPYEFQLRLLRRDGTQRLVHGIGRPATDEAGEITSIFGVFQDVTAQVELRDRLAHAEKMASIGTLAAGVAHEINNPLNYVTANTMTLSEELADWIGSSPSARLRALGEVVDDILEGARRIEKIVSGLKIFARSSEGDLDLVDLVRVVDVAERLCRNELRRAATFVHEAPDGPVVVLADESKLVQVVVNLIVNACHAIDGPSSENRIVVRSRWAGNEASLEVRDTGRGMSEEIVRQAFTPFYTTKRRGVGTGLGLAISHGIIASFGGSIVLDSIEGEGTTVRVTLPAADGDPTMTDLPVAPPRSGGRKRILIVDDEPLVGRSISRVFRGHEAVVEDDPLAALRRIERGEQFDAIVCDLMMPKMGGDELYEAIASTRPELAERFIVVTGGALTEETKRFAASGVTVFRKPIDIARLRAAVEELDADD